MNGNHRAFVSFMLLLALLAGCNGPVHAPSERAPPKQQVYQFARAIWSVEKERDQLVLEFRRFTLTFMDMPTTEVFRKGDYFLERHAELRNRMQALRTSPRPPPPLHHSAMLPTVSSANSQHVCGGLSN